ncbi:transposase [Streptomyces sp. NPDC002734]|uniref:Transposase n=1 Tax=Streptomyces fragilis TaxID=67301 RepID=A0ABV2YRC1_9ACTN|nr:transposase [Streptomyces fragilis]
MVRRHEFSVAEWAVLSRLPPSSGVAGRPRSDDRVVLNGIAWKPGTGSAWRDVPERYGSRQTLCTPFRRPGLWTEPSRACCGSSRPRRTRPGTSSAGCRSLHHQRVHQHAADGSCLCGCLPRRTGAWGAGTASVAHAAAREVVGDSPCPVVDDSTGAAGRPLRPPPTPASRMPCSTS